MEVSEISDKGQIQIPLSIRRKYNLNSGDIIILKEREDGLLLVPKARLSKLAGRFSEKGLLDDLAELRNEERDLP